MDVVVQWGHFHSPWKSLIKSDEKLSLRIFDLIRASAITWCSPLIFTENKGEAKKESEF